jgi:pimeloyl-ACP methyl ester carboxylesterase
LKKINNASQGQVSFVTSTPEIFDNLCYALFIFLLPALISFPQIGQANPSQFVRIGKTCLVELIEEYAPERSGNLSRYERDASRRIAQVRQEQPLPDHSSLAKEIDLAKKWQGIAGPQAFEAFLPNGLRFLSNPTPNAEHNLMAGRLNPETSGMARVNFNWRGNTYGTDIYFTKPIPTDRETIRNSQSYLIGPEIPIVYWRIHGGGTPSAVASNASTAASFMLKHGIATIAVDQQGHGRGVRDPVMSMEDQIEMNLEIMSHLLHPNVKVMFDGHSWGGEAAYVAWRLDKGNDPRYRQIIGYIAESPPGDVTLGGSARDRLFSEEAIWKKLVGENRDLVADSDWSFMNNIVRNLKISGVAPWATDLTFMGYKWDPISPEDVNKLKPLLVIVGQHDGLVYVGREKAFREHLGQILPPDRFVVLEPGRTYENPKSTDPLKKIGHQISDRYQDGTEKPDALLKELKFISEISGMEFPEIRPSQEKENAVGLLYRLFLLYSNNFAAREFLNDHVEYIRQPTKEQLARQDRSADILKFFSGRQNEITRLATKLEQAKHATEKELNEKFQVKGGYDGAKRELEVDRSPERKRILHEYHEQIEEAEKRAGQSFDESPSVAERIKIVEKYGESLVGQIEALLRFREVQKTVGLIRKLYANNQVEITQRIDHLFRENNIDTPKPDETDSFLVSQIERFSAQPADFVPAKGASRPKKDGFAKVLASCEQALIALKKEKARRYGQHLAKIQEEVAAPKGIHRPADAMWELKLQPLTPERRVQLSTYIRTHGSFTLEAATLSELAAERELAEWEEKALSSLLGRDFRIEDRYQPKTEGYDDSIYSVERATYRKSILTELEEFLFVTNKIRDDGYVRPFTAGRIADSNNLSELADRRIAIKIEINQLASGLQELNQAVNAIRKERHDTFKKLSVLLSEGTSQALTHTILQAEEKLADVERIYNQFSEKRMNALLGLEERGELTREAVLAQLPDFVGIETEFSTGKENYLAMLDEIKMVRLSEAHDGNLVSAQDPSGLIAKGLVASLLGDFKTISEEGQKTNLIVPSPESLEARLFAGETERDNFLSVMNAKMREWNELGIRISEADQDSSGFGPTDRTKYTRLYKIEIRRLLNHSRETLLNMLTDGDMAPIYMEALRSALTHWESQDMWRQVLYRQDDPKNEWYALKGH